MQASREKILSTIRRNLPQQKIERPEIPIFEWVGGSIKDTFVQRLTEAGGAAYNIATPAEAEAKLKALHPDAKVVCSAAPEIAGNRRIEDIRDPHELADVDVGVVRAQFGVAEGGAVWLAEEDLRVNALGVLSQHLIVLPDPEQIVSEMHEGYRRVRLDKTAYGCFMMGPSATADVEATLIHGAQGARSLNVLFLPPRKVWNPRQRPVEAISIANDLKNSPVNEPASILVGNRHQPHRPWKIHWQRLARFDPAKMEPRVALRNAIGVALPIAGGVAMGNPAAGLAAGVGALQVCYSDTSGPYRLRAHGMLAATLLCSLAVVAGGMAVRNPVVAGVVILVWGFCAGLVACLGENFENLGAISLVTLIIYAVQPLSGRQALLAGILAVSGGLLQTALALLFWPVRRYAPYWRELSALYLELSEAAIKPATSDSPPVTHAITAARETLAALSGDRSVQAERLWSLLNQAERIRLSLLAVRRLRKRLLREFNGQDTFRLVDEYLSVAARVLHSVGESISRGIPASGGHQLLPEVEMLADRLRQHDSKTATPSLAALQKDLRFQMNALTGQLRAVVRTTRESTAAGLQEFAIRDARRPWRSRFFGNLAKLRANLTLQSAAFRHAVRLTLCLAVGEAVAHLLHHPRSYWLAMTIVIVLRQEFASTIQRGTLRICGTIVGLCFATILFHVLSAGIGFEVLLVGAMVFVLRWAGAANYGVFSVVMSALVVLMLAVSGVVPMKVIFPRAEMTILGGLIALATFVLWPTWERGKVPEMLAQLLSAYREYFAILAKARIDGRPTDEAELGPGRMAARLARSNMEAAFERLRAEPATRSEVISLLAAMLANSHRFVRAIMALEVLSPEAAPTRPEFRAYAADVDTTLDGLVRALRGEEGSLRKLPDLREDHQRLLNSAPSHMSRYELVNEETDRMTNSLNTLAEQVGRWITMERDGGVT